mmetsp:Transcript_39458/g.104133  ORF Transcript_39458/g.104133 Transcript_39458/m.104133 type:complete len:1309 (+) Transcript_39458:69-3995(+)
MNGRPYWRRNGNPGDCLVYVPAKGGWTLSGTPGAGDSDVYVATGDAPLPPKHGWKPRAGGGSFGSRVPEPAPSLDYAGGGSGNNGKGGGSAGGGGTIEFLGLWKDTGDRALPIKMNVNPGDPNQIRRAFDTLVGEMRAGGVTSGIFAAQSYNQMHWSANPKEQGYKKHGLIGFQPGRASRSTWSGREHRNEGMRIDGFDGKIDILGGDWQNAVYKVTLGGEGNKSKGDGGAAGWVGNIRTLDMARKDGRGGFKIHPVLAVTGRTVGGKEELVPGFVDQSNHVNHSLDFHKAEYKAVKGHVLPKGEKLGDKYARGWLDASSPRHPHRAQKYTGPVHLGIALNYDGNGNYIYGDIIGDVMWYEWWGCHQTRDFQYVKITSVSRTVNAKGDWPWSKLVDQAQWPGEASAAAGSSGGGGGGGGKHGLEFFLLHDADFAGQDARTTTEACGSLDAAAKLLASKPLQPSTCYAWRRESKLVSIPAVGAAEMGNGAKWVDGAELIVCGKDTGHRSKGKLLIALENVDCCFGDGHVFSGVSSYDAALRLVKDTDKVEQTAYFWHSSSSRLIEKPKNRGANWVGYPGYGWLFLWADERIGGGGSGGGGHGSGAEINSDGGGGTVVEGHLAFHNVTNQSFDKNGVLYAIGTDFGRCAYSNPADSGKVAVKWSPDAANYYSTAGGHRMGDATQAARVICANQHLGANATMWSQGQPGAWFTLDLKSVSVRPTHFAYRNDYGGGGNHPRTFELQGSTDGVTWVTLSKHHGETWSGHSAKHWPIHDAGKAFSQFRVLNQGEPNHLCCSGIELYGHVGGGSTTVSTSVSERAPSLIERLGSWFSPKVANDSIGGVWLPTRVEQWRGCPVPEHDRSSIYLFTFDEAPDGTCTFTGLIPEHQQTYQFGSRAPLRPTNAKGTWSGRAGDTEHGEFDCTVTLKAPDDELELVFAQQIVYYARRRDGGNGSCNGSGSSSSSAAQSAALRLGSTPSHGNPASTSALNTELNNIARNTDDTATARALVASGADLASTNGEPWRHTPLHQAAFHGRFEMAKALVEMGAPLELHSNSCGRGAHGTPLELARGGGHHAIAQLLEEAMQGKGGGKAVVPSDHERAAVPHSGHLRKVEVGRVMSWYEYRARAEAEGGQLPTTAELAAAGVDVGYDQWTPIMPSAGDRQTGRRDGSRGDKENAWANIGPRKYQIEYPAWGLDASSHAWKHLTYFYVAGGGGGGKDAVPKAPVVMGVVIGAQACDAVASEAVAVSFTAKAQAPMTLMEQVTILKRELGLQGNVKDVLEQAAAQLSVSAEGKPLAALAAACMNALGH